MNFIDPAPAGFFVSGGFMQIKRNNDIPLSRADSLVDLVRRYVIALDPEAKPHEVGIVRSLVPVMAGTGGIFGAAINDAGLTIGVLMGHNACAAGQ